MSYSWAAFAISFTVCIYAQWLNPENPPYAVVTYPERRVALAWMIYFAAVASFIGIVLMGVSVAILDVKQEDIDKDISTTWGGVVSLLPVIIGFTYGTANIIYHNVKTERIRTRRGKDVDPSD